MLIRALTVAIVLGATAASASWMTVRPSLDRDTHAAIVDPFGRMTAEEGQVESLSAWVLQPRNPAFTFAAPSRRLGRNGQPGAVVEAPSVANRNRNPLNIKLGWLTRRYLESGDATVSSILPLDGGAFLRFDSPEVGFRAAAGLLMSERYLDLDLDDAIRRWSNDGVGGEILARTGLDEGVSVRQLAIDDLKLLMKTMATAEGYRSPMIAEEIARALRD